MRSALYNLRVGGQVLDEHNVQPLAETVAALTQNQVKLQDLCRRANDLIGEMDLLNATNEEGGGSGGGGGGGAGAGEKRGREEVAGGGTSSSIKTGGDLTALTANLTRK